jgi:hypothetical protein
VATIDTAQDRLDVLRARLDELDPRERLADLHLRGRLEGAREQAGELGHEVLERASEVRERVPELLEDLEPASRRARIKGWELVRTLIGVLLILPRLLVRLVGVLPNVVERAAEQGGEVADRARHVAGSVPSVRHARRRRQRQLAAWTAGGFVAGAVTGWLLGRRTRPELTYEATVGDAGGAPVPTVDLTAPAPTDPTVRE